MKKAFRGVGVAAIVIVIVLLSKLGLGVGYGVGTGEENAKSITPSNESEDEQLNDKYIVKITVAGNDYIYDNSRYSFEELTKQLKDIEENYTVDLSDDQASKKAFDSITEYLESNGINYKTTSK